MKLWCVITPEYDYTEPILDDGSGPTYPVCDVVEIEAEIARDAIVLGVKYMLSKTRREFPWVHDQRSDNCCPYTGVKAELLSEEEIESRGQDARRENALS